MFDGTHPRAGCLVQEEAYQLNNRSDLQVVQGRRVEEVSRMSQAWTPNEAVRYEYSRGEAMSQAGEDIGETSLRSTAMKDWTLCIRCISRCLPATVGQEHCIAEGAFFSRCHVAVIEQFLRNASTRALAAARSGIRRPILEDGQQI